MKFHIKKIIRYEIQTLLRGYLIKLNKYVKVLKHKLYNTFGDFFYKIY